MIKKQIGEKISSSSSSSSSSAANDKHYRKRFRSKRSDCSEKNVPKVVRKTMRMMNTRLTKSVELPEKGKKTFEQFD